MRPAHLVGRDLVYFKTGRASNRQNHLGWTIYSDWLVCGYQLFDEFVRASACSNVSPNRHFKSIKTKTFKLGKKSPRIDSRTFKLSNYLAALPPIPSSIDWGGRVGKWFVFENDWVGDCTVAACGHLIMDWTANANTEIVPTNWQIINAYSAITGYNPADTDAQGNNPTDTGADCLTVLGYWINHGIAGQKLAAYAAISPTNLGEFQASVYLFGGAYVGVQLPQSALDAVNTGLPWTNIADKKIVGGHCIPIVAYDANGFTCVTCRMAG
jgi:hypothetical protein